MRIGVRRYLVGLFSGRRDPDKQLYRSSRIWGSTRESKGGALLAGALVVMNTYSIAANQGAAPGRCMPRQAWFRGISVSYSVSPYLDGMQCAMRARATGYLQPAREDVELQGPVVSGTGGSGVG